MAASSGTSSERVDTRLGVADRPSAGGVRYRLVLFLVRTTISIPCRAIK